MKVCTTCGQRKPLSAFYKQKGGAQRRRGRSKECYKAAQREHGRAAATAPSVFQPSELVRD